MKKFVNPMLRIDIFDEENIIASGYIQAVQDYIATVSESEALHKRMELFNELLEFDQ